MVGTKAGLHFFDASKLPVKCHTDDDEWVGLLHMYYIYTRLHSHLLMNILYNAEGIWLVLSNILLTTKRHVCGFWELDEWQRLISPR